MAGHAWKAGHALNPAACLFRDEAERERFIEQLGERVEGYGVRLYAYCLMLTHFHLYLASERAGRAGPRQSLRNRFDTRTERSRS